MNATTTFLPLKKKGGLVRFDKNVKYISDKEEKCWTEYQARHVHKKVEMEGIINTETMK